MKKILIITNRVPQLSAKGDQISAYRKIDYLLNNGFEVYVLCIQLKYHYNNQDSIRNLKNKGVFLFIRNISLLTSIKSIIFHSFLIGKLPIQVAMYKDKKIEIEIDLITSNHSIDFLIGITSRSVENYIFKSKKNFAVDFIDSLGMNFRRRATISKWPLNILLNFEANRLDIYEKKVAAKSSLSWVVSHIDRNHIGDQKIHVLPVSVDILARFKPKPELLNGIQYIGFTGNMNYHPNVHALIWFLNNCWGQIIKHNKSVILKVAGRNISNKLKNFCESFQSVMVVGEVVSMEEFLTGINIAVAPMQSGSGMQLKILEAMSASVPIVTTSLGFGDLKSMPGVDLYVEDDPLLFSSRVIELLSDKKLQLEMGICGLNYVIKFHSDPSIAKEFITQFNDFLTTSKSKNFSPLSLK